MSRTRSVSERPGSLRIPAAPILAGVLLLRAVSPAPAQEVDAGARRGTATLLGIVRSAETGQPLEGARVSLPGLGVAGVTSESGAFKLDRLPGGKLRLAVEYLGFSSDTVLVKLEPTAGTYVALTLQTEPIPVPALRVEVLAAGELCGTLPADSGAVVGGALGGRVRDAASGDPVEDAVIWIRPKLPEEEGEAGKEADRKPEKARSAAGKRRAVARAIERASAKEYQPPVLTDPSGRFLACGLPTEVPVEVQASAIGKIGAVETLRIPAGGFVLRDLTISDRKLTARVPEAKVAGGKGVVLKGVVRSRETGDPVAGARVQLMGTDLVKVTGREGTFVMSGLRPGRQRVVTDYLGMSSDTAVVNLVGQPVVSVAFQLQTRPVELPGLDVKVERTYRNPRIADFYRRSERGVGKYITREQLEYLDVVGAMRRIPSVDVRNCGGGCWRMSITRGGYCPPAIFLNGTKVDRGNITLITSLPRDLIEGIEVYRGIIGQPGLYSGPDTYCGLVMVWLANPPRRRR